MKIAIHNPHKLPNLTNMKIHNYALEMMKKGYIDYVFFDDPNPLKNLKAKISLLNDIRKQYSWKELGLGKVKFIFTGSSLNQKCDILLNFNSATPEDFTPALKNFKGIKVFHVMDYFWKEPGSKKYERLQEFEVDYLMSYARSDRHCEYFKKYFPGYIGKVIPVPFGFASRFAWKKPFSERKNKCVALGSVNPLRPEDADPINYTESADFFEGEKWFHKFRRMIVENLDRLSDEVDSMLPVYPKYKDNKYDLVEKLNDYRMFVSDESIFNFPAAKAFEGPASGTVMVCSEHQCFKDYGFIDGVNCIMHKEMDIEDMKQKISSYQRNPEKLEEIQKTGYAFAREKYSHEKIADYLNSELRKLVK